MKTVLITGASGFIARNFAVTLSKRGYRLIGTSRKPTAVEGFQRVYPGVLEHPLERVFQEHKIDAMIHCAFDTEDLGQQTNEAGTLAWADQASQNNVGLQIFVSSISASDEAVSAYGRAKFGVEKWFHSHQQVVFRLGLVVGNGGMFQRMVSMVKRYPVIPVIGGKRTRVHLTDLHSLVAIVGDCLERPDLFRTGRAWHLQQEPSVPMMALLRQIRTHYRTSCVLVPFPFWLMAPFLWGLERLPFVKSSFNTDNVKGLRFNSERRIPSDLASLGYSGKNVDRLLGQVDVL